MTEQPHSKRKISGKGCAFSLHHYKDMLLHAQKLGYRFITLSETGAKELAMREANANAKIIVLRHDIDIAPVHALEFAKIEHMLGIRASYFILLHEPTYNPFDTKHFDILRQIMQLGHEIGLHYEARFFEQRGIDPYLGIAQDMHILTKALRCITPEYSVRSISQHNPASAKVYGQLQKIAVDAYHPDLINGIYKYLSDSGRSWREGCLCQHLGKQDKLHVLIHPVWWMHPDWDFAKILQNNAKRTSADIKKYIQEVIRQTYAYLERREKLDAQRARYYR